MAFGNETCKKIVDNICPYCKEHLLMNKRSFANHIRWCKNNPKYEEMLKSTKEKLSLTNKENYNKIHGELKEYHVNCYKCGKDIIIKEHEYDFPLKEKYFCSRSCVNSHKMTETRRQNISKGVIKYNYKINSNYNGPIKYQIHICPICGKEIKGKNKYCSKSCNQKYKLYKRIPEILQLQDNEKIKEIKKIYKRYCQFQFSLKLYPNEFDFNLINKYGWYKAKNKGNNLTGISRDHKYSCQEAFKNLIDPYLISHPANCQLLQHNQNSSKYIKCSITLKELKHNIKRWNKKYGEYPNKIDYKIFENLNIKFNK